MIRYHDLLRECSPAALASEFPGALMLHWEAPTGLWHTASAVDFAEASRLARSVLSPPTPYSPALVWISPLTRAPPNGWPHQ